MRKLTLVATNNEGHTFSRIAVLSLHVKELSYFLKVWMDGWFHLLRHLALWRYAGYYNYTLPCIYIRVYPFFDELGASPGLSRLLVRSKTDTRLDTHQCFSVRTQNYANLHLNTFKTNPCLALSLFLWDWEARKINPPGVDRFSIGDCVACMRSGTYVKPGNWNLL